MNLDLFFTLQNKAASQQNGANPNAGNSAGASSTSSASQTQQGGLQSSLSGLRFMDVLMQGMKGKLDPSSDGQKNLDQNAKELRSGLPSELELEHLLGRQKDILQNLQGIEKNAANEVLAHIQNALGNNQNLFEDQLNLSALLSEEELSEGSIFTILDQGNFPDLENQSLYLFLSKQSNASNARSPLRNIFKALEDILRQEDGSFILANLSPQHITQLQNIYSQTHNNIADETQSFVLEDEDLYHPDLVDEIHLSAEELQKTPEDLLLEEEGFSNIFIGLIALTPPKNQSDPIILENGIAMADSSISVAQFSSAPKSLPANDLGSKMSALMAQAQQGDGFFDKGLHADEFISSKNFKALIKEMADVKTSSTPASQAASNQAGSLAANNGTGATPGTMLPIHYLQAWGLDNTAFGSLFAPLEAGEDLLHHNALMQITSPANMANLVTSAPSASHMHPSSQHLAIALQQSANNQNNKRLTLQLDPPELGKVEVIMEFSKGKTLQAHLIVEKPETLAMLQRDAQSLEKTIQEIGLDQDSSLSFELAQGEQDFNQDQGQKNSAKSGSSNGEETTDEALIESTLDWYFDPNTGHTHYSILA